MRCDEARIFKSLSITRMPADKSLTNHLRGGWNETKRNEWDECGEVEEWNLWQGKAYPDSDSSTANSGPQRWKARDITDGATEPPINIHEYTKAIFFQGPIGRKIRTTVTIRWSFAQMCCVMSLVCSSIASQHTSQFWARSEPVNMPKTIESPPKCGVRAVIRFLYSEKATRNVVLRYCPSSWQCSTAHCCCNREVPEAFSMGSVWSPTIIRPNLAPCDFHLFIWNGRKRTTFWHNEL